MPCDDRARLEHVDTTFGLKGKKNKVAGFRARTTTRGGPWTPEKRLYYSTRITQKIEM